MGLLMEVTTVKKPEDATISPLQTFEEIPIPAYQFALEIDGVIVALFQSISGMVASRKIEPLEEGGVNNCAFEYPGRISYEHVNLASGLSSSDFFWKWMMAGNIEGRAKIINFSLIQRKPNPQDADPIWVEAKRWNFINAFPVKWSLSDLNITESEQIAIETLEISFDYFELA
jgi:phage tail-like protein